MYMISSSSSAPLTLTPAPAPVSSATSKIVTLFIVIAVGGAFLVGMLFFWWPAHQQAQILKTGIEADATITNVAPTGNLYNNQPQVRITLQVHPTSGGDYTADVVMVINPVYLSRYQPGTQAHIRYDQHDRTKIAIEEVRVVTP